MILSHRIFYFLNHWLREINDYSLHSPFLFDFYTEVIRSARSGNPDLKIEAIRKRLKRSKERIQVRRSDNRQKGIPYTTLRSICRSGITKPKYSILFQEIINYFELKYIIELGTSLGINTLYLAKAGSAKSVRTFENNKDLISVAENNFSEFPELNITVVEGNIEDKLPLYLRQGHRIDMAYVDANHTLEATLKFYSFLTDHLSETAVLIFDDIYWSPQMTKAWKHICRKNPGGLILDLYQVGLIIKKKDIPSGYFHLAF